MASMMGGTADWVLGFLWKALKWLWEKFTVAFQVLYNGLRDGLNG
jgi:hypothetical protein